MSFDLSHPVILRPSRVKFAWLLVLSLGFIAIGIFLVASGTAPAATGWLGIVFFGLCGATFVVMLLPGAAFLRLDPDGYTVCALFRSNSIPWTAVHGFGVTRLVWRRVVGVNFTPGSNFAARLGRVNTRLVGYEGALPDTYGMSAGALAALMNDALAQARSRTG